MATSRVRASMSSWRKAWRNKGTFLLRSVAGDGEVHVVLILSPSKGRRYCVPLWRKGRHKKPFPTTTNGTIRSIDDSYLLHRVLGTAPRASLARRSHCRRHSSDRYALLPPRRPWGRALASDTIPPHLPRPHTLYI